jgi:hypothetical protein
MRLRAAHRLHHALEPGAVARIVDDLGQHRAVLRRQPAQAPLRHLAGELARGVERQQRAAAVDGLDHHRTVHLEVVTPAIVPPGARAQRVVVDAVRRPVVEHALERALHHLQPERGMTRREAIDDLQLRPVMVRIGMLLADAHGARLPERRPERLTGDLAAGARIDDAVRQRRRLDAAHRRAIRIPRARRSSGTRRGRRPGAAASQDNASSGRDGQSSEHHVSHQGTSVPGARRL